VIIELFADVIVLADHGQQAMRQQNEQHLSGKLPLILLQIHLQKRKIADLVFGG
jgi:hypothetical protein